MPVIRDAVRNYELNESYQQRQDDRLLDSYGIYVFSLNEDFGGRLMEFKEGVTNAIKKLNMKIGREGGYIVKHIIDEAKKHGRTALIAALTMLSVFGGTQNAEAKLSETQEKYFIEDCEKIYTGDHIKKYEKTKKEVVTDARADHRYTYCVGFSTERNYRKAYEQAQESAA